MACAVLLSNGDLRDLLGGIGVIVLRDGLELLPRGLDECTPGIPEHIAHPQPDPNPQDADGEG